MRMYQAGILGASTLLAKELMTWLSKWHWIECPLVLMDEAEKTGEIFAYQSHYLPIHAYEETLLKTCDIVFDCMETRNGAITEWIDPKTYVIHMQEYDENDKVIAPNVNLFDIRELDHNIFIPYASFLLLSSVLAVAKKVTPISTCTLTSFHSAAELGYEGRLDFMEQLHAYERNDVIESEIFPLKDAYQHLPLLFQSLPQTSALMENGTSEEEFFLTQWMKACFLSPPDVNATCVRVPSLHGLSMSITLCFGEMMDPDALVDGFACDPSFICIDDVTHNMYPICADVLHDHRIYIGRMRMCQAQTFSAWTVCDDLAIRASAAIKTARYLLHNII